MTMLETRNLEKWFGSGEGAVRALGGIDLSVGRGEFVAIMGASGSGKSTLLNVLGGLEPPSGGEVLIAGEPVTAMSEHALTLLRRDRIGFIFQAYNLLPVLTARENVALPLVIQGRSRAEITERTDRALKQVDLWERRDHLPSALSGGQQQRVAIARALVKEPAVILADEPTGNLDSRTTQEIMALLSRASREYGQTLLLITHDPSVAAHANRILTMQDGRLTDERRLRSDA
ncbi:MAG: ABC transporter ATP-binding protein [Bacillota bacterium]